MLICRILLKTLFSTKLKTLQADKLVLPLLYFLCSFSGTAIGGWKRLRGLDPTASICRGIKCCFNITVYVPTSPELEKVGWTKIKIFKKKIELFKHFWEQKGAKFLGILGYQNVQMLIYLIN